MEKEPASIDLRYRVAEELERVCSGRQSGGSGVEAQSGTSQGPLEIMLGELKAMIKSGNIVSFISTPAENPSQ